MKCPICKKEISELEDICPNCKTNFDEYEKYNREHTVKRSYADWLNIMANINIVLSIIAVIGIWINFSTTEIQKNYVHFTGKYTETVVNWYGIIGGIAILITGLTLFFLLKTIANIYWEIKK